jgi:hypothetical protein
VRNDALPRGQITHSLAYGAPAAAHGGPI